jgi:aspartate/methionine/tyrosine aminotransferase
MFSSRLPSDLAPNRLTEALRARRARGESVIDLTVSNTTRAGFEYPRDLLEPLGDPAALVYDPHPLGLPGARLAVSAEFARRGLDVRADQIALTASTSEAYSMLFRLLTGPGDDVLVPRPSYPLFDHLTQLDGVVARPYNLEYHGRWSVNVASVEAALTARTRALLVVQPNNPTGSFLRPRELEDLARLCAPRGIAIIRDEVFADYELEPHAAASAARVLDRADVLAFSLGGLSKSIGLPQVKLGWIAVGGSAPLREQALARLELVCDTYLSVSTPVQVAVARLLERGAGIRRQIHARVLANDAALRSMAAGFPWCSALRAEGGWSAVLQVPAVAPEEQLVIDLLASEGVLVHPGYFFDFAREAFVVVSLLATQGEFAVGVDRLLRHFDCSVAPS